MSYMEEYCIDLLLVKQQLLVNARQASTEKRLKVIDQESVDYQWKSEEYIYIWQ